MVSLIVVGKAANDLLSLNAFPEITDPANRAAAQPDLQAPRGVSGRGPFPERTSMRFRCGGIWGQERKIIKPNSFISYTSEVSLST